MDPRTSEPLLFSWLELFAEQGGLPEEGHIVYADLVAHYSEPHRHYHTLGHLAAMFDTLASLHQPAASLPAVRLAVWFHDVIYDPRASDNEERSSAHAQSLLRPLGWSESLLTETARLILLTKTHQAPPDDDAGQVLLDADLAILGASEEEYDRYARAIRQEYAWVPQEQYRTGRGRVLRSFLDRPRLYFSEEMVARAEQSARRNLQRELARLG